MMKVAEMHQPGRVRPKLAAALAAPALLFLIVTGFYWKLVLSDQFTWLASPDVAQQVLPWFQFQAGEWHAGRFPLWDPHQWFGQPLLGQVQPGAAYPLNWLLFLAPLKKGWINVAALDWYFVLVHYLAALFCYWLCRDLKRGRAASVAGAIFFSLGGYVGTTDWPQMLNGAIWAPLVILFLLRALEGRAPLRSAVLAGFFLGLAWLAGHHQVPLYITLAAAGVWLYHVFRRGRFQARLARLALVFATLAALTSGLQTLPAYEYGKRAYRWVGAPQPLRWNQKVPYSSHVYLALSPASLVGLVVPGAFGSETQFVGSVGLALALAGVVLTWKQKHTKVFVAIGLGALLFTLGPYNFLHGVLYSIVPLVEKARSPASAIALFHLAVAALIAAGADGLTAFGSVWLRRAAAALAAFAALVFVPLVVLALLRQAPWENRAVMVALVALLAAAVLAARLRKQISARAAAAALIALMAIELGNVSGFVMPSRQEKDRVKDLDQMARLGGFAEFLRRQPRPLRVQVDSAVVPFNFGDWYGVNTSSGYLASLTANLLEIPNFQLRTGRLLGISYSLGKKPPSEFSREVFNGPDGLKLYFDPEALPRAWTVHEAVRLPSRAHIGELLEKDSFDPRVRAAVLTAPPSLEPAAGPEAVEFLAYESSRVQLRVDMKSRGLLVLSDTYFPGWKASVDGAAVSILEVDGALRGVVVPPGRHTVEFQYRPLSVYAGAAMTLAGFLLALLAAVGRRRALGAALLAAITLGCASAPDGYPPPIQRKPLPDQGFKPVPTIVSMDDPSAGAYIVSGVNRSVEATAWRWTGPRPEFRFQVSSAKNLRLVMDFTVAQATFEQTGPVTVSYFINGKLLGRQRCDKSGEYHYNAPVPAGLVQEGALNIVAAEVDKPYVSGTDGARLGLILTRVGLAAPEK